MPKKATDGSGAYDLYAPSDSMVRNGRGIIPLNFRLGLPKGYVAIIKPRSEQGCFETIKDEMRN